MNNRISRVWRRLAILVVALFALIIAPGAPIAPVLAAPTPAAPTIAAPATPIPLAWGANGSGQLGNGSSSNPVTLPVLVDTTGVLNGKTVTALAAGYDFSLALDSTGAVYAWGYNDYGQIGGHGVDSYPSPVAVDDTSSVMHGKTITAIAAGGFHSLAVDSTGQAYAWGSNDNGQLGNDSVPKSFEPVAVYSGGVLAGKKIVVLAAGYAHSLALDSTGAVYAWGAGDSGQRGNATQNSGGHAVAVDTSGVLAGKKIIAIAAGAYHSLALDSTGAIYAWGDNSFGELGNNSANQHSLVPVAVDTSGVLHGKTITAIAAGWDHSLALDSNGQVYAWGDGNSGQLGNGSLGPVNRVPVTVDTSGVLNGKTITAIAGCEDTSLALDSAGQVYAWGDGYQGQLGNGTSSVVNPVPVATILDPKMRVTALGVGSQGVHTLALAHTGGPTWDYDITLQGLFSDGTGGPYIAEGWLHTVPDPQNPANSIGTFTDNLAGGKTYPVTYDGATMQLTLNTIYGKFVLNSTFSAVSHPTRFGSDTLFSVVYYPINTGRPFIRASQPSRLKVMGNL